MPEGPELFQSATMINNICKDKFFTGRVIKSEVSTKNPEIPWYCSCYTISATSKGKELMLTLSEASLCDPDKKNSIKCKSLSILLHFGMSGLFTFTSPNEKPKHAHLCMTTKTSPPMVLSFVDARRFGRWMLKNQWSIDRGPCPITEPNQFRSNVLSNLDGNIFSRPICEVMLNQSYFNGIGNYLRAEVLHRLGIAPFLEARSVLSPIAEREKLQLKREEPDLLDLCCLLPLEVVALGASRYSGEPESGAVFNSWLRCYCQPHMQSMADRNKRTIWFAGAPGPLTPKGTKDETKCRKRKATRPRKSTKASKSMAVKAEVTGEIPVSPQTAKVTEVNKTLCTVSKSKDVLSASKTSPRRRKTRIKTIRKSVDDVMQESINQKASKFVSSRTRGGYTTVAVKRSGPSTRLRKKTP